MSKILNYIDVHTRLGTPDHNKEDHKKRDGWDVKYFKVPK